MVKKVITVPPDTTVERAAYMMQQHDINALPVVRDNKTVGIVTSTDIMGAFLDSIGMDDATKRLIVFIKDIPGSLSGITELLKLHHINIMSLITWPDKKYKGVFQVILRVSIKDGDKAVPLLKDAGYSVIDGYVEDYSAYIKE